MLPTYREVKNYLGQRWSWIGKRPSQLISCVLQGLVDVDERH
jgi:hypothetical protein